MIKAYDFYLCWHRRTYSALLCLHGCFQGSRSRGFRDIPCKSTYSTLGFDGLPRFIGTGTQVGNATEIKAAGNVSGPSRSCEQNDHLVEGYVKTNLGHLEGACALPEILKVVAALEQGEIPPTLRFQILVGGTSPIGRCIMRWMVSRGPQHLSV